MKTDGWITIGTKLSTKDLEIDLRDLKKSLNDAEKENKVLIKAKLEAEEDLRSIEAGKELYEQTLQTQLEMLDTEEERNIYMQEYSDMLELMNTGYEKAKQDVTEIDEKLEQNVKLQTEIKKKIADSNRELANQKGFESLTKGMTGIISKVATWGLMLFGIRSAYSLISRSISTLSQQDKNMSSQLEYIRWTMANAIAPIVKFIINAVYLILQYVNQITRALFGFELFKGPKDFAKSMKSASGSAEKIKKTLAGFDEMNILGDNTATAGGGGAGGVDIPEFDTDSVIKGIEKVKEKSKELAKTFRDNTMDMNKALADPSAFTKAYKQWDKFMYGITQLFTGLNFTILGISDVVKGVFNIIKGIINGDSKLIMDGIKQTIKGIGEFIYGLWLIVQGTWNTIWGFVKGVLLTALKWIGDTFINPLKNKFVKVWDDIKALPQKAFDKIKSVFSNKNSQSIGSSFGDAFSGAFKKAINWVIDKLNWFVKQINKINIKLPGGESLFKVNVKQIPKLARGTILNNPGRGIDIGGAIAGEAGREAVLPLSDSRLLEELGSTIGRYITINLTNETKLDGRTIARKISQLNNSDDFLRNR